MTSTPAERPLWQIHLSTALALMIGSGLLLGCNVGRSPYVAGIQLRTEFPADVRPRGDMISVSVPGLPFNQDMIIVEPGELQSNDYYVAQALASEQYKRIRNDLLVSNLTITFIALAGIAVLCERMHRQVRKQ